MNYSTARIIWKRRPSEIRGYHRTLYLNDDNGDYLRVDYNLKEKRVRLYVELADEGGNPYYSVISNGKITAERSVSSGRSYGFSEKFSSRAEMFSTIPNREVLKLINRNYNIRPGLAEERRKEQERLQVERQRYREEARKKYFKPEKNPYADKKSIRAKSDIHIAIIDVLDAIVGILVGTLGFLYFQYSYVAAGIMCAFFGIIIGFIDMFFRRRSPVLFKVLFFVIAGTSLYIYGYFLS